MPLQGHKSDFLILGILGALTGGLLLIFIFLGWIRENRDGAAGVRTTRSTNVDGMIVCHTLFEKLGISVKRIDKTIAGDTLDDIDVFFVLDPLVPIHTGEITDLQLWLSKGGVLISTYIPYGLTPGSEFLNMNRKISPDSFAVRNKTMVPQHENTHIPPEEENLPLARDISTVYFDSYEIFDNNSGDINSVDTNFIPLLADSAGLRVVTKKFGQGHIIVLSDSSFMANGLIGRQDNSVLAVNLVSYALSQAKGKRAGYDEYHLGYGHHESGIGVLSWMMVTTPAGWAVSSLIAAGSVFLVYKGRRFGIRRGLQNERRRSKLEYIYAVGATYRAGGANRLTLNIIFNWFKHKIINLIGLMPNASNDALAAALSRRNGVDSHKYKEILDRCDKLLTQKSLSQRHLLLTIKQLGQIELEVFNERRNRK